MARRLTHINPKGETTMVDVSAKRVTMRRAVAHAEIKLPKSIVDAIKKNRVAKGNVLETARLAGIQAAKKTSELIPLCHQIPLTSVQIRFELIGSDLRVIAEAAAEAKTGVEMEALTAAAISALTVYDMCKGIDKGMVIGPIVLIEKSGGKSGTYRRSYA